MSLELEDHPWFPAWMRRHQMAFLSFMALRFHLYQPVAPLVRQMLEEEASGAWTDCCTGAAGPVQYMLQQGCRPAQLLLTDKYPIGTNIFSHEVSARWEAVDVLQDAIPGQGLITFFNAFHHFTTAQRQQLLTQIAATKRPLLIAEITQPTVPCWMLVNLSTTLGQILFAPFIKPFSWRRLFFTYLVPVHLVTVTWDGCVSVLRSIRRRSFERLCVDASTAEYRFRFQQSGPWWRKVSILTGQPIS